MANAGLLEAVLAAVAVVSVTPQQGLRPVASPRSDITAPVLAVFLGRPVDMHRAIKWDPAVDPDSISTLPIARGQKVLALAPGRRWLEFTSDGGGEVSHSHGVVHSVYALIGYRLDSPEAAIGKVKRFCTLNQIDTDSQIWTRIKQWEQTIQNAGPIDITFRLTGGALIDLQTSVYFRIHPVFSGVFAKAPEHWNVSVGISFDDDPEMHAGYDEKVWKKLSGEATRRK